jgi:hypothetical protein
MTTSQLHARAVLPVIGHSARRALAPNFSITTQDTSLLLHSAEGPAGAIAMCVAPIRRIFGGRLRPLSASPDSESEGRRDKFFLERLPGIVVV